MPTITVYRHGFTAGIPPSKNSHMRAKRGDVGGWSASSTRSNTRFLRAVLETQLTGDGFALSLTVRECPATHAEWVSARRAFLMRLQRLGLVRCHWLTEWQRRGVPHMHAAIWLPADGTPYPVRDSQILNAWLAVAESFGAGPRGQHIAPISDSIGWFKYLSKHASRGVSHYQRSPDLIPAGWQKTGRMWGHTGDWPLVEGLRFDVDNPAFWAFRRIARGLRLADARSSGSGRRIRQARQMLQDSDRARSAVRGASEWLSEEVQMRILEALAASGYNVRHLDDTPKSAPAD